MALVGKLATRFQQAIGEELRLLVQESQEANGSVADSKSMDMRGLVMSQNRRSVRSMRGSMRGFSQRGFSMRGLSTRDAAENSAPDVKIESLVCMPTPKHLRQWIERNVPHDDDDATGANEWTYVRARGKE